MLHKAPDLLGLPRFWMAGDGLHVMTSSRHVVVTGEAADVMYDLLSGLASGAEAVLAKREEIDDLLLGVWETLYDEGHDMTDRVKSAMDGLEEFINCFNPEKGD